MTFRPSILFLALLSAGCATTQQPPPDSLSAQFASAKAAFMGKMSGYHYQAII